MEKHNDKDGVTSKHPGRVFTLPQVTGGLYSSQHVLRELSLRGCEVSVGSLPHFECGEGKDKMSTTRRVGTEGIYLSI